MTYSDFNDISNSISDDSVLVTTLGELRSAAGYNRLGPGVLKDIAVKLRGIGATYFPYHVIEENPQPRATDEVRLVPSDSQVGKIVDAVQTPTLTGDDLLNEVAGDESADTVQQIKALLGL